LEKAGEMTFTLTSDDSDPEALQAAIDDYILVSMHCWKSRQSTVNNFVLNWMQLAASQGCLRLGILRLDDKAIAAQFWLYSAGVASMLRVNFHEQFRALCPGVVLTNLMIEYLLDVDKAESLDFGYGGEEYKGRWVGEARGYSGIMAFNPGTPRGFYFGIKHIFGQQLKRKVRRGRSNLQSRGAV
jgi:Acetyltransferase (GNAT) domain